LKGTKTGPGWWREVDTRHTDGRLTNDDTEEEGPARFTNVELRTTGIRLDSGGESPTWSRTLSRMKSENMPN
jgi:hypothetical protein